MKIDVFKVEEWMNEYEKYSKFDLGNTTVNTLSLNKLFEITNTNKNDFFEKLSQNNLGYGYITGNPNLKKGICSFYKTISENEILPTIGAAGANHLIFYSLIEPNDRVISVIPTYQQLYSIPKSFNADVKYLHLTPENNFLPDIDELKGLITKNTKLICLNNPNNPSGSLIPDDLMKEIVEIARKNDIYILCDEVYKELNQNEYFSSSIADLYENGISVCSMSKTFSLAGLRLGWLASKNKKIIKSCMHHREYNMISCSMIDEKIAALALTKSEEIISQNKKILSENLEILDNWVQSQEHFKYIKPHAGTTALLYYDFDVPSKEFCHRLSKQKGVFTTPGFCFELEHCFRIGYGKDKKIFSEGLKKISEFAEENRGLYDTRILK